MSSKRQWYSWQRAIETEPLMIKGGNEMKCLLTCKDRATFYHFPVYRFMERRWR